MQGYQHMAIKPIPLYLLIHHVDVVIAGSIDRWGNNNSETLHRINNVRVEPQSKKTRSGEMENVEKILILYHDTHNSTPFRFRDKIGSSIVFDDMRYTIEDVKEHYTLDTTIHHQEVFLR